MRKVILIGGQSSRMGYDKSKLLVGNETFLNRICRALNDDKLVISINKNQSDVDTPYELVYDEFEAIGPMNGIYSCLHQLQESIFVTPCDQPMLTNSFVAEFLTYDDDNYDAIIACDKEHTYPTLGIYHLEFEEYLAKAIRAENYRMMKLLGEHHIKYVDIEKFENKLEIENINTKEDYEKWLEKVKSSKS